MDEGDERLSRRTWYVLHVKPRTEKKVFEYLRRMGVFRYLPLLKKVTKVQRRKVTRYLPLFPGYVFTRLDPEQKGRIYGTQMLVQAIVVDNPRQMVHQLRQIVHAGRPADELTPVAEFSVGEYVRVRTGPFMGLEGYVQRKDGATSLVLALEILGRAVEVKMNPGDLEPLSPIR